MSVTMERNAAGANAGPSDPIFEYLALLHEHGVGSAEANAFKEKHRNEKSFRQLARGAEWLFQHKEQVLAELDQRDACER